MNRFLRTFCLSVIMLFLSFKIANAGLLDFLFGKDSCRSYSDYTCKELENSNYNVYFYFPDNTEYYLGVSSSLTSCNSIAVSYANKKNMSSSSGWGYICCLKTKTSECAEKHR